MPTSARSHPSELQLGNRDIVVGIDSAIPQAAPQAALQQSLDRATLLERGIFGFEHEDPRSRAFAMLRSQLLRRLDPTAVRIIAVTSTQPRNGKSFVAINLAAALSQIHPTCLVDLDLRRPTVGERLELEADTGVDDYLLGEAALAPIRCGIGERDLLAVPVREPRARSADMLASQRTSALFEQLRALPGAPVCIVDTPPVLEGDDTMILARHVDGILFVVEEGNTRRAEMRQCLRMLQPTPIIGTVLNRVISAQSKSSYGQYYGYRP